MSPWRPSRGLGANAQRGLLAEVLAPEVLDAGSVPV